VDLSAEPVEVVVYGTVCLDRFCFEGQGGGSPLELAGGEAFNTATMLVGWGVRVALAGTATGDDPEGARLRGFLTVSGVDAPPDLVPHRPDAVTPFCEIIVAADGERRMSGRGFAHAKAPEASAVLPLLALRPVFAVCPNLGAPAVEAALTAARAGCPVVAMDFAPEHPVTAVAAVWQHSADALRKAGHPAADADPEAVVRDAVAAGARAAVLTLGPGGGVACGRNEGPTRYEGFVPPEPVVDSTGAGDAFRAGLCWSLLRGLSLPQTLRFAAAAAALHCTRIGGGSRVPLSSVTALARLDGIQV